jgi:hypothetical protein
MQMGIHADRKQADRQADRQADWMREGGRHADGDACRHADGDACRQAGGDTCRQEAVRQVGRPA